MPAEKEGGRLRNLWLVIHRWLGLGVCIFFAIASLTGAVLVYEHELDAWINGDIYRTTPGDVGPEAAAARAAQEIPGELALIRWPTPREPFYKVEMRRAGGSIALVRVDPGSGLVAEQVRAKIPVTQAIRRMHTSLLAGRPGHNLVLFSSALALISLITGFILWWPGIRRMGRAFTVRLRRGFYPFNFDVHQVAGTITLPFLFLITLTGVMIPYQGLSERVLGRLLDDTVGDTTPAAVPAPTGPMDVAGLLAIGAQIVPDGTPSLIRMPAPESEAALVEMLRGPHGRAGGIVAVRIDPASTTVLSVSDPAQGTLAERIAGPLNFNLHVGAVGGAWVRVAYVLLCLTGAGLAISGALIWWLKRARIAERAARTAPARPRAAV